MEINIKGRLNRMHNFLMYKNFPYHSVSVIYRFQDLGFHCIFMNYVKEMINDEIKQQLEIEGFTYHFTGI